MELCRFGKEDHPAIKALYSGAFPANERAPFGLLTARARQGRADFWVIRLDRAAIGMAYVVTRKDLAYLFYFAIAPSFRGKGYGTGALKAIMERYRGFRLFLALEDWREEADNRAQRIRRHEFYLHCGLHDLPHRLKEASVIYAMMGSGGPIEPEEYKDMMNRYVGFPMRFLVDMRIIP